LSLSFSFGMYVFGRIEVLLGERGHLFLQVRDTLFGSSEELMS